MGAREAQGRQDRRAGLALLLLLLLLLGVMYAAGCTAESLLRVRATRGGPVDERRRADNGGRSSSWHVQEGYNCSRPHVQEVFWRWARRRRMLGAPASLGARVPAGSTAPSCKPSTCSGCRPCTPVHVPIQPGRRNVGLMEYYPEAWRCACNHKLFIP